MVVFLWWCSCGGVFVVVLLCTAVFVVFLCWCLCGGVFVGGVFVVVWLCVCGGVVVF